MKLHKAIEQILKENGSGLTAREVADAINARMLYQRGDETPVPTSQIHARVKNYPSWFKKEDGLIYLVNQES